MSCNLFFYILLGTGGSLLYWDSESHCFLWKIEWSGERWKDENVMNVGHPMICWFKVWILEKVDKEKKERSWNENKVTTGREHMGRLKQISENNLSTKQMKMQFKEAGYRNWKGVKRIMLLIAKEVGGVKLKGNMKKYSLQKCCH